MDIERNIDFLLDTLDIAEAAGESTQHITDTIEDLLATVTTDTIYVRTIQ